MKTKYKIKFYLILFFTYLGCVNLNAAPRCEQLYDDIYNEKNRMDVFQDYTENQKTIGIRLLNAPDQNNKSWKLDTSKEGYFKVGKITKSELLDLIRLGDEIISINGKDLRILAEDEEIYETIQKDISDLFEKDEEIIFKIKRKNLKNNYENVFFIEKDNYDEVIYNNEKSFTDYSLDFWVNSIEIDQKNNYFDASIQTDFLAVLDDRYDLTKLFFLNVIDKKKYEENRLVQYLFEVCYFDENRWHKLNTVDPSAGWIFDNVIKEEKQLREAYYYLRPSDYNYDWELSNFNEGKWSYALDEMNINFRSNSVYRMKTDFNLQNFPFDKQKIKILLRQDEHDMDYYRASVTTWTLQNAQKFKEQNNIEGWNIKNVNMNYHITDHELKKRIFDGFELEFEIERKSSYYIYKIILPIFLILIVCWSAVWINPKQLESRLTITIVCLLSLIAYNFVIDKDLPKLEYFTILDYLILVSYIYAAIPTFISVVFYQSLSLKEKNKKQIMKKANDKIKKFGLLSYFLIMIYIVIFNINSHPEYTNSLGSWMALKF